MKIPQVSKKEMEKIHPAIPNAYEQLEQGRISRREFMRFATLLGMSAGVATVAAACGAGGTADEPTTEADPEAGGSTDADTGAESAVSAGGPIRGGTWRSSMNLQGLDHPARLSWVEGANIVRQFGEYLTETGVDNITRPYLLESWEANETVDEWTLNIRQGVLFNNGDELTAEDVMFTMGEWLNPDVGSSMLGLLAPVLSGMNDVEMVDDYTIRLHLTQPNIAIPEFLFHYPAIILHRNFEGDIIRQPVGTGAFTLEEYAEGERAVFRRREDYWRMGEDGMPLPYLDELIYVSSDKDAGVAALTAGQVDSLYDPRPSDWQALQNVDGLTVRPVTTAQCLILRMRVDLEPWNDNRVRTALKMCQNREQIFQLAYFSEGELSIDAHVAPVQPAYAPKPIPEYDPEGALALMEEYAADVGIELPLQVTLATKNDQAEPDIAQALKEQALPGGFDITLDITYPNRYLSRWTEVPLGITSWTHRPVAVMLLPLASTEEAIGNWNETRWVDEEFEDVLREAQATLDVEERRELMSQIEDIMQERGPIGNSFWKNIWNITSDKFHNVQAHPTAYDLLYAVWKDPE